MCYCLRHLKLIPHPHLLVPGHQQTVSTNNGCNQWLSLAKTLLKVALASGNRSLVSRTGKCGWAISGMYHDIHVLNCKCTYMLDVYTRANVMDLQNVGKM